MAIAPAVRPHVITPVRSDGKAFSEQSLPGLLAWWSPRDAASVTLVGAPADDVSQIDDLSGNGHHMVQATAAQRPQYPVPVGDSVGFHPDTNDMHLENGTVPTGAAQTVAVVLQPTILASHAAIGTGANNNSDLGWQFGIRADGTFQFAISNGGGSARDVINSSDDPALTYAANDMLISQCTWDGGNMTLRINGHIVSKAATQDPTRVGNFALGASAASNLSFDYTGKIGDCLVCDALTTEEQVALEAHWAGIYGVAIP